MKKANVSILAQPGCTFACCDGLREAESSRPPEQGRSGVQRREVLTGGRALQEGGRTRSGVPDGAVVSGDCLHEPVHPGRGIAGKPAERAGCRAGVPEGSRDGSEEHRRHQFTRFPALQPSRGQSARTRSRNSSTKPQSGIRVWPKSIRTNKEAYYSLGVITWAKWYPRLMEARAKLGMKPEDPGPHQGQEGSRRVEGQVGTYRRRRYQEPSKGSGDRSGIRRCHGVHEPSASANAPISRAILKTYKKDTQTADNWVQKALETKKIKAERVANKGGRRNQGRVNFSS